jgi:signal transduction histidine kinase
VNPLGALCGSGNQLIATRTWLTSLGGWVCWFLSTGDGVSLKAQVAPLPELRTAREIRQLSPAEAERHYPVHLRGTITFFDERIPTAAFRFVQDETAGIYFYPQTSEAMTNLAAGQLIEITGLTGRGEFAPVIEARQIRILGEGKFPTARPVSFEDLISGREDSQFVEVNGVVRSVQLDARNKLYAIELATGGGRLAVTALELPVPRGDELTDSTVKVRGVCCTQFNQRRQLFGTRLLIPRSEDLRVEQPTPKDPFAGPTQTIGSLLQFAPEGAYGHRVKVAGTVIYRQTEEALYIEDLAGGLYLETQQGGTLAPGDKVEVAGFPAQGEYTPMLQDAIFRKVGSGPAPVADELTGDEALKGTHDCRLVRIKASVVERARKSREEFLVLDSGGVIFQAYLERRPRSSDLAYVQNGSQVAVTGVCLIEKGSEWFAGEAWRAKSFRVLMRSAGDLTVLKRPPWWTLKRLSIAFGVLTGAVLLAFAWVAVLRRRVARQTQIIAQKLQAEAALTREILEASNREQRRIGQDLHDGVCQQLAAIAYRTDVLAGQLQEKDDSVLGEAEKIGQLIAETISQTRGVARGLFPVRLEENGLVSALEEMAANASSLYGINCRFDCERMPLGIENGTALHLYYIAQEAVLNAAKHSRATLVLISLAGTNGRFELTVQDDGAGFDLPGTDSSGMGIRIMRYRARVIGATLDLKSKVTQGTTVTCAFYPPVREVAPPNKV